jgi:O-antigen ligase
VFLIGGFCIEIVGVIEGLMGATVFSLMGGRSMLGADLTEVFLAAEPGRINGAIGDAAFHGIFVTTTAAFSVFFFFNSRRYIIKIFCVLVFLLAIYNVIGTGSRGAFLSMVIMLLVFWIFAEIPHKTAIMAVTMLISCIVILVIVFSTGSNRAVTYSEETSDTSEMRVKNVPVALKMFVDYPLFGIGPDGFIINFSRYATNLSNLGSRETVIKTHNTPVQLLAEYGLIGFFFFFLTIYMAIRRTRIVMRNARDPKDRMLSVTLLATITAYTFFMLTSNSLLDKYFWLMIIFAQINYSNYRVEIEHARGA